MADPLEASMNQFVEKLKEQLPRQITISQEIDVAALQQGLEESVRKIFEEKYRSVNAELQRQIEDMKRNAEQKVAQMKQSQEIEQKKVTAMFTGLKGQQDQQIQLMGAISNVAMQKQQELANSLEGLKRSALDMQTQIDAMRQEAEQLQAEITNQKQKAALGEVFSGGRIAKFMVQNKKAYYLENIVLRFMCGDNIFESGIVQQSQPQEGPTGVPGLMTVEMKADLPVLPEQLSYSVFLVMNNTQISNSVTFDT